MVIKFIEREFFLATQDVILTDIQNVIENIIHRRCRVKFLQRTQHTLDVSVMAVGTEQVPG
jgi:hypothetical protein